jgi:Calx-beta domain/Regulator of chromosome condensation (RCC1) repeat
MRGCARDDEEWPHRYVVAATAGRLVRSLLPDGVIAVRAWIALLAGPALIAGGIVGPAAPAEGGTPIANAEVVSWGYNDYRETIPPPDLIDVKAVAAGNWHSLALRGDGSLVAWGNNDYGQATVPAGLSWIRAISAGYQHNLALQADGTVVGWGYNNSGQVTVPSGLRATAIAAGAFHSLAVRTDGTVAAWGSNSYGETTPPSGLAGVVAVAAGYGTSYALKSDGTITAWGRSDSGQINVPAGLGNVTAIAAGWYHALALKSDGTVVAWGQNYVGQASVPAALSDVVAISASATNSAALTSDGTPVLWGNNDFGQRTIPTGLPPVAAVAASWHTTVIVAPSLSVGDKTLVERNSGTATVQVPVALNWPMHHEVLVNYATVSGTADSTDFHPAAGTLVFSPGDTSKTIPVEITGDAVFEPNETFLVYLSSPSGAVLGDGVATVTIANDDPRPAASVANVSAAEGNAAAPGRAVFTVRLTNPSWRAVQVDFATVDGTATAPSDYTTRIGSRTIEPGDVSAAVSVPLVGDTTYEPDETFGLRLLDVTGATVGTARATGTITNDDPDVTPPVIRLTAPASPFTLASTAQVKWVGSDNQAVAGYEVRYQRAPYGGGFGAWSYPAAWQALPASGTTVSLTGLIKGYDYCVAVRASDVAGNRSPWTSPRCVARPLDDRALSVSEDWSRITGTKWWNQTITTTKTRGAVAARTGAQLDRVGIVATRGPGMGTVGLYVGVTLIGKINLAAGSTKYQAVMSLPAFSYRTGTVSVKVLSSGKPVHLDGLAISRT